MNAKKILADFQIKGNRVSKYNYECFNVNLPEMKASISYDIDYNILDVHKKEENWIGLEELCIGIQGKVEEEKLFDIQLVMEGLFIGNGKQLTEKKFLERLQLNGLATLSHLSRAYIMSVSSLSGINPSLKMPMFNIHSLIKLKLQKENDIKEQN